jgi:hypothetical protein
LIGKALTPAKEPREPRVLGFEALADHVAGALQKNAGDDLEKARALCQQQDTIRKNAEPFSGDAAYLAFLRQQQEHTDLAGAGRLAEPVEAYTLADWETDFEQRREAASAAANKVDRELAPFKAKVLDCFCRLAGDEIADLESSDAAACARYGVPYKLSPLVITLKTAVTFARGNQAALNYILKITGKA